MIWIETLGGRVPLWGSLDPPGSGRLLVLAIAGAFAAEDAFRDLPALMPEAGVLVGHLPGNHSPPLRETSVAAYIDAYAQVVRELARPVVVLGTSIGGVVALGLKAKNLKAVVALDPPLRTGDLWPFTERFRQRLSQDPDDPFLRDFLWNVFGISPAEHQDRDHRPQVAGPGCPTFVLCGGVPLQPERVLDRTPSLVGPREREWLERHRQLKIMTLEGVGHAVRVEAPLQMLAVLRQALALPG